jgi:hypothetical protein
VTQAHEDPFAEVRSQAAQVLAVAATVGEAAARWYAVGVQNRAAATERDTAADETRRAADRLATDAQEQQDRQLINQGLTEWLSHASMEETVRLWRTATIHAAAGDPRAAEAANRAQDRLRTVNTPFMDAYDRRRAAGMPQADAMRAAAYDVWEAESHAHANRTPPSGRPHRGKGPALPAAGDLVEELDAAVRAEAARLATHVDPDALATLQRQWRAAGMVPAADAAALLHQFADDAVRTGAMSRAAADGLTADPPAMRNSRQPAIDVSQPDQADGPAETAEPAGADQASTVPTVLDRVVDNDSEITNVAGAQRHVLIERADSEQHTADVDGAKPDDPSTPDTNEHRDGQDQAGVHTEHADADFAAAAHQQELMRHAFPQLTNIGQLSGHVATRKPATATPAVRKAKRR